MKFWIGLVTGIALGTMLSGCAVKHPHPPQPDPTIHRAGYAPAYPEFCRLCQ